MRPAALNSMNMRTNHLQKPWSRRRLLKGYCMPDKPVMIESLDEILRFPILLQVMTRQSMLQCMGPFRWVPCPQGSLNLKTWGYYPPPTGIFEGHWHGSLLWLPFTITWEIARWFWGKTIAVAEWKKDPLLEIDSIGHTKHRKHRLDFCCSNFSCLCRR